MRASCSLCETGTLKINQKHKNTHKTAGALYSTNCHHSRTHSPLDSHPDTKSPCSLGSPTLEKQTGEGRRYCRPERDDPNTPADSLRVEGSLGRCLPTVYKALGSSLSTTSKNKTNTGAGEMAQWLRALDAFPVDLGSILSTHITTHNCL